MTYREAYERILPPTKRQEEKYNVFVSAVVRPLSILMTLPLIKAKIKPTTITKFSIISLLCGFGLLSFTHRLPLMLVGWGFLFLWALLDGVDGNLARCTNQCSSLGDLWDTMGGYIAMVLINYGAGIAAFYDQNLITIWNNYLWLMLGGFAALFSIFPRLIMHKKKSSEGNVASVQAISNKNSFGLKNILAMNVVSPSGFMQIILLMCIIFHTLNLFVLAYAFINFVIMLLSLYKLLKE